MRCLCHFRKPGREGRILASAESDAEGAVAFHGFDANRTYLLRATPPPPQFGTSSHIHASGTPSERKLRVGTLEVQGLAETEGREPVLAHLWEGPGDCVVLSALPPSADGNARVEEVPAGSGSLVRINLDQSDFREWEVVEEVRIVAGSVTRVILP